MNQLAKTERAASWHALPAAEIVTNLGSTIDGLAEPEAKRRLAEAGPNVLPSAEAPRFERAELSHSPIQQGIGFGQLLI